VTVTDHLDITKTLTIAPSKPGDPVQYKITVFNLNVGVAVTDVEVKDILPPAQVFTYLSSSAVPTANAGGIITWNKSTVPELASIADGSSFTITINGTCGSLGNPNWPTYDPASYYVRTGGGSQNITNNATVSNPTTSVPISATPVNNTVIQSCGVDLQPSTINGYIKSATPSFIYYVVTLTNTGNITDKFSLTTVPSTPTEIALTFEIQTLAGDPLSQTGWIQPGHSINFVVKVSCTGGVNPNKPNTTNLIATSFICGTTDQTIITTNSYGGQISGNECNLQITKIASANPVTVGTNFYYTITISNTADVASDIAFVDHLPTSLTYVSSTSDAGADLVLSYNSTTNEVRGVYLNDLARNAIITITITVTPGCTAVPSLTNTAEVVTSTEDLDYNNNTISLATSANSNISSPSVNAIAPICSGATATLTATGANSGYDYRWYDVATGGAPLGTGASFTTPVLTTDKTFYVTLYETANPTCESNRVPVVVSVFSIPVASAVSPATATICEGGSISFAITATGTPPLSYKWQVDPGTGFVDVVNNVIYSGATTNTLLITGATIGMNGYKYHCMVQSGTCGFQATSSSATLSINASPIVTVNSPTVCANLLPVTITATVNPSGTYTYVWTVPAGATNPGNVASFSTSIAGAYSVTATNTTTTCSGSGSGTLTINPLPTLFNVTGGGGYCTGGAGMPVGLSGSQSGINYQLQLNGVNTGPVVPGTGAVLNFGNQTSAGAYTVIATNPTTGCSANMTGSATVTIKPLPTTSPIYHR
jgi:uncharacterized repeat protein (TIGR01451 family)